MSDLFFPKVATTAALVIAARTVPPTRMSDADEMKVAEFCECVKTCLRDLLLTVPRRRTYIRFDGRIVPYEHDFEPSPSPVVIDTRLILETRYISLEFVAFNGETTEAQSRRIQKWIRVELSALLERSGFRTLFNHTPPFGNCTLSISFNLKP